MTEADYVDSKTCPICGENNKCNIEDFENGCWCENQTKLSDIKDQDACLCEECLCGK